MIRGKYRSVYILFLCILLNMSSLLSSPFIVLTCRSAGMFSIFNDVLLLLHGYENQLYSGIEVNFNKQGFYYDPNQGINWWEYYCEPICLGEKKGQKVLFVDGPHIPYKMSRAELRTYNRLSAYQLINKYIHIKPDILKEVNQFVHENFEEEFVIGVHYRGTDKVIEAPRLAYAVVNKKIQKEILDRGINYFKIFIATDEEPFVDYMQELYPDQVCFLKDNIRSNTHKPIHSNATNPYQQGREALLDCLLLSRTHLLIRTSSNLSLWSTYFNPYLTTVELSQRYIP